ELINEIIENYYKTFQKTLDSGDFVPEKYNKKITRFIYCNMKKSLRVVKWLSLKNSIAIYFQTKKENKLNHKKKRKEKKIQKLMLRKEKKIQKEMACKTKKKRAKVNKN
ncbi:MAG: hypothetical protein RR140_02940, partial [Clostridia bacterium]